jgi:hypothetical protein
MCYTTDRQAPCHVRKYVQGLWADVVACCTAEQQCKDDHSLVYPMHVLVTVSLLFAEQEGPQIQTSGHADSVDNEVIPVAGHTMQWQMWERTAHHREA